MGENLRDPFGDSPDGNDGFGVDPDSNFDPTSDRDFEHEVVDAEEILDAEEIDRDPVQSDFIDESEAFLGESDSTRGRPARRVVSQGKMYSRQPKPKKSNVTAIVVLLVVAIGFFSLIFVAVNYFSDRPAFDPNDRTAEVDDISDDSPPHNVVEHFTLDTNFESTDRLISRSQILENARTVAQRFRNDEIRVGSVTFGDTDSVLFDRILKARFDAWGLETAGVSVGTIAPHGGLATVRAHCAYDLDLIPVDFTLQLLNGRWQIVDVKSIKSGESLSDFLAIEMLRASEQAKSDDAIAAYFEFDNEALEYFFGKRQELYAKLELQKLPIVLARRAVLEQAQLIRYSGGDSEQAIELSRQAIELGVSCQQLVIVEIEAHNRAGNFAAAIALATTYAATNGFDDEVLLAAAIAYYGNNDKVKAVEFLHSSLEYNKNSAAALLLLGVIAAEPGEASHRTRLGRYIRNIDYPEYVIDRAYSNAVQQNEMRGLEALVKACPQELGSLPGIRLVEAQIHRFFDRHGEARLILTKLLKRKPSAESPDDKDRYRMQYIALYFEMQPATQTPFQSFVELGGDEHAFRTVADHLQASWDHEELAKFMHFFRNRFPDSNAVWPYVATVAVANEDWNSAIQALEAASSGNPQAAELTSKLINAYCRAGRVEEAYDRIKGDRDVFLSTLRQLTYSDLTAAKKLLAVHEVNDSLDPRIRYADVLIKSHEKNGSDAATLATQATEEIERQITVLKKQPATDGRETELVALETFKQQLTWLVRGEFVENQQFVELLQSPIATDDAFTEIASEFVVNGDVELLEKLIKACETVRPIEPTLPLYRAELAFMKNQWGETIELTKNHAQMGDDTERYQYLWLFAMLAKGNVKESFEQSPDKEALLQMGSDFIGDFYGDASEVEFDIDDLAQLVELHRPTIASQKSDARLDFARAEYLVCMKREQFAAAAAACIEPYATADWGKTSLTRALPHWQQQNIRDQYVKPLLREHGPQLAMGKLKDDPEAIFQLCRHLETDEDWKGIQELLDYCRRKDVPLKRAAYYAALLAERRGAIDEAIAQYEAVIKQNLDGSQDAIGPLTKLLTQRGRAIEAWENYGQTSQRFEEIGQLLVNQVDADGIEQLIRVRGEYRPKCLELFYWRGEVHWLRGEIDRFAEIYGSLPESLRSHTKVQERQMAFYVKTEQLDKAREFAEELATKEEGCFALVYFHASQHDAEKTLQLIDKMIQLWSKDFLVKQLYEKKEIRTLLESQSMESVRSKYPPPEQTKPPK